jgi:hypothetical protein
VVKWEKTNAAHFFDSVLKLLKKLTYQANLEHSKTLTVPILVCEVRDRGDGVQFDGEKEILRILLVADLVCRRRKGATSSIFDGAARRSVLSGTGLGLRVCKALCSAMQCEELGYRPHPLPRGGSKGSIFFFRLPLFEQDPSSTLVPVVSSTRLRETRDLPVWSASPESALSSSSNLEFLLVDDSAVNVQVLAGMLTRRLKVDAKRVTGVTSGAEALEFLLARVKKGNVSTSMMVLVDIQMPILNGNEMARLW